MSNKQREVAICRACVTECEEYKSIHKHGIIMGEVTTLAELLLFCTNLEFPEDDYTLPSNICLTCVQNLARSYAFKKLVIESNDLLRKQQSEFDSNEVQSVHDFAIEEQQFVEDEVVAEELQELANAAQIKQAMDNMNNSNYITMSVVQDITDDGDEPREYTIQGGEVIDDGDVYLQEIIESTESNNSENEEDISMEEADDNMPQDNYEEPIHETKSVVIATNEQNNKKRKILHNSNKSVDPNNMPTVKTRFKSQHGISNDPQLQCQICKKQLSNINSFKYHMQLHSDETPFLCSLCGAGFKTRNSYEGHLSTHNPNNPNTCDLCGKSYRQSSSLRTHMMIHTGEKPYKCNICGKGMTQKSGYKKHMLTHTGEKPHTCDICGREFRYSSNLFAHKRSHSDDKPYECVHCEKTFQTLEQKKRHSLVHTGDRPFSCEQCGKTFKRRSSLMAHKQVHEEESGEEFQIVEKRTLKSKAVEVL